MTHHHARRLVVAIAVAAVACPVGLAAAGTEPTPSEPAPAAADAMSYCTAHLALEAAMSSGDPAMIGPAVNAVTESAPAEIADALAVAIESGQTDGPPTPEFVEAYGAVTAWVSENCGFASLDVLATDYAFGGIPDEVPAGPTVVSLTNDGEEMHEIILIRRNDGVTTPVEELLALPEEEAFAQVQFLSAAFAAPGEVGHTVVDLAPGEYIALCFIPVGTTLEVFEQMSAAMEAPAGSGAPEGSAPAGSEPAPHFAHGMIQEFTVTGDAVEMAEAPATTTA